MKLGVDEVPKSVPCVRYAKTPIEVRLSLVKSAARVCASTVGEKPMAARPDGASLPGDALSPHAERQKGSNAKIHVLNLTFIIFRF